MGTKGMGTLPSATGVVRCFPDPFSPAMVALLALSPSPICQGCVLPCSPSAPGLPTSPPLGCAWTHAPLPSTPALLLPPFLGLRRLTLPSLGERRGVSAKWMGTCVHTCEPLAGTPRWGVAQPMEEADVWGALAPSLRKGEGRWGGACRHPSPPIVSLCKGMGAAHSLCMASHSHITPCRERGVSMTLHIITCA